MRFKLFFTQQTSGTEHCEAVIEADNQVEALAKFAERDFTTYLVTKSDLSRVHDMDGLESIEEVS